MALRLRGSIWYADYYANGERVQESTGTANKREAEKFLALRISEVQRNVFVRDTRTTFDELWDRYRPHAETHKRSWKRDVQLFGDLRAFFGNSMLRDITPARIEKFQQERGKVVAPATVNRAHALGKHLFFMAQRWGLHAGNPFRLVRFLPEENIKCVTLSREEEGRLLAELPRYIRDMVAFDLSTGLRISDLRNLKWEDVNIEQRLISIIMKKNRKPHEVALNRTAMEILSRQDRDSKYVFTNPIKGTPVKSVRTTLEAAAKRAGLKNFTWHVVRHTVATRLLEGGVDIVSVKEIMGHANIKTTLRYAHSTAERQRPAMEKLAGGDNVVTMPQRQGVA